MVTTCREIHGEPLQEAAGRAKSSENKLFQNSIFQVTSYTAKAARVCVWVCVRVRACMEIYVGI